MPRVRITKCGCSTYWYSELAGYRFSVYPNCTYNTGAQSFYTVSDMDYRGCLIRVDDCEVLPDEDS